MGKSSLSGVKQASEVTQLARVRARALVQVRGLPSVTPLPSGRVLSLHSLTLVSSLYMWGRRDSNELKLKLCCCCSVAQLCLTLQCLDWLQHARPPCPSLSPRLCSNSCPMSRWCHSNFVLKKKIQTRSQASRLPVQCSFQPSAWLCRLPRSRLLEPRP